jgi:GT2 family glycosyltransferase
VIPALIVPILNRPDLLHRMLDSIDYPVRDLLIIDNGDCFPAWEPVEHVESVHVLKLPTNLGVPASWNLGIKALPFAPWWLVMNSDAWFPSGTLERFMLEARSDALVLSAAAPPWACYAIGDEVVSKVGLFDEGIYPAYFEDDDMVRRCRFHGIPVVYSGIPVWHDNSSTIGEPRFAAANSRTFYENRRYYAEKVQLGDMSAGSWSLTTRRELSWD